jgi:hypothetical protein
MHFSLPKKMMLLKAERCFKAKAAIYNLYLIVVEKSKKQLRPNPHPTLI